MIQHNKSQHYFSLSLPIKLFILTMSLMLSTMTFAEGSHAQYPHQKNQTSTVKKATVQSATTPPQTTHKDLAKASQNPIASLISVPFENDTYVNMGPFHRTQNILFIKPVIPMQLAHGWSLVTRVIFPLLLPQPIMNQPHGGIYGLGDINPQFYFVAPSHGEWMFGAGPSFITPSASNRSMGTGKWSGGPTAVAVWSHNKVVAGLLVSQVWSFAGQSNRRDVSTFTIQPFYNYNFEKGWFFYSNPIISADWKAKSGSKWTVPVGGGFGRIFQLGHQHMKLQAGVFGNIVKPKGGANWQTQVSLTLLFPQ